MKSRTKLSSPDQASAEMPPPPLPFFNPVARPPLLQRRTPPTHRRPPSLTDIKDLQFFDLYAPPSRIPVPTSSRRSSISSVGTASRRSSGSNNAPTSRRSSISNNAPISSRTSSSSISSLVEAPVDPRSPNPNSRLKSYLHSRANRSTYLDREDMSLAVWSLDELVASIPEPSKLFQALLLLLANLRDKPMSKEANLATVGFVRDLLDLEDATGVVKKLCALPDTDIQIFLDFFIYLLDKDFLLEDGAHDTKRKAKRLALKLLKMKPVMPRSLFLTEIAVKTENQQVGRGGFAFVLKGEMTGLPVALKILYKAQHDNVRACICDLTLDPYLLFETGSLQRGVHMADVLPRACTCSPRDP
ncbi:hypothetical protein AX14_009190 [Amanita brunnescens Koide BX004]|nr:hypothetical protein AX14_009190 [Amanita brunnescens Koide BX004]